MRCGQLPADFPPHPVRTPCPAQIGQNVNRDELQQLEWNLLGEAKMLFHQRKFEEALNTFTHCLAVTEKTRSAKDHAVRGAVIHNIASCLHNLGEMEAAQVKKLTANATSSPFCLSCCFALCVCCALLN